MSVTMRPIRRPERPAEPGPAPRAAFAWSEAQAGARAFSSRTGRLQLVGKTLAASDAAVVMLSSLLAYLARHGLETRPPELVVTLLGTLLTVNAMRLCGAYRMPALTRLGVGGLAEQIGRAVQAWSLVFTLLLLLGYLTKTSGEMSRLWVIGWYLLALAGFVGARLLAAAQVRRWHRSGRLARTVAIVDLGGTGDALARELRQRSQGEIHLVGVFQPRGSAEAGEPAGMADGDAAGEAGGERARPVRGIEELIALSRLFRIDEVIVTVRGRLGLQADAAIRKLATIPTNVRLCPEMPALSVPPREAELFFGHPILTVCRRPLDGWSSLAKRAEDIILGSLLLVLLAPVMAVIALLVRLDSPGPALFRQQRLGFNNNEITVYKFRSMTDRPADAEVAQARRGDPRVTRLGRFLRRSSLDELPQLLNVLRGEMSLVGPRPHALAHNAQYAALIDDYLGRHRMQPGITGWAQVNGYRGETDTLDKMQRRVEHDLAYIDNWSILLDLKILFLTALFGIFNRNAY